MNTIELSTAIKSAYQKGLSYAQYRDAIQFMAQTGSTSGPNQSEAMVNYTRLNAQRMNRWDKKVHLSTELATTLSYVDKPQHWIVITESWCGDAAHNIPTIAKMEQQQPLIQVRYIYRDENLELMDQFLTNGGRSIPKVILADENFEPYNSWGPRPAPCQTLYLKLKKEEADFETQKIALQKWYNSDKQQTLMNEFCTLIQERI
jgi:hypothetical protein